MREALSFLIFEGECLGNGHWLADSRRLDQQVVEAIFFGQPFNFDQQIFAKRAADTSVGHLNELLFGSRKLGVAITNQCSVNVDFAHVVDDNRNLKPLAIRQNVVQKRSLASSQKAAEHGHREFL